MMRHRKNYIKLSCKMEKNLAFLKNHALKTRDFILDLIFPIECLGCGNEKGWICPDCFNKLTFKNNRCFNCKTNNLFGEFCPECQPKFFLDGIWIAGDYDNLILAKAIKALKYYFVKDLGIILGNYISKYLLTVINLPPENKSAEFLPLEIKISRPAFINLANALIIPVPLHKKRLNWRGFNQAEIIAGRIAKNFNIEINNQNLIRIKNNQPQASLNEEARVANTSGCFYWQGEKLISKTVILADDVATTGATLNECAKILKQNGAEEVWGLVAAKG